MDETKNEGRLATHNTREPENEEETEEEEQGREEEERLEDARQELFLRALSRVMKRNRMDVSNFLGTLNPEELIDWIGEMEEYFKLEEIRDLQWVKIAQMKLKGYDTLWWKGLQREWEMDENPWITRWNQIVTKLKNKFILGDNEMELFKKLQNLKQKYMSVKDYIKEFYKLAIQSERHEIY